MSSFLYPTAIHSLAQLSPRSDDDAIECALEAHAIPRPAFLTVVPGSFVQEVQESLGAHPDWRRSGHFEHHTIERPIEIEADVGRRLAETQAQLVERPVEREARHRAGRDVQPR